MSDYNSSLPVRTENAGDVIAIIADATITSQRLAVNSDGSINITDNGAAITVDATDLDIRDLDAAQDNVAISDGTDTLAINADGSINATVSATNLDIRDLTHVSDSIKVGDGTDFLAVNADGSINATVSATDLDIRDLNSATDSVTVVATDLDVRDLDAAQDNIAISDGTDTLAINNDGSINATVSATDLDIRDLNSATDSVTVLATDLDIRDLTHASDSVKVGDGTDFLAVNSDGSINVVLQEDAGTEKVDYNTAAAVASGATSNHDYTTLAAAKLYQVWASASGKLKIEVQVETASGSGTFNTIAVGFNSTATPNINLDLSKYKAVVSGAKVRVIRTNKDNQSQDVYSTIVLIEG